MTLAGHLLPIIPVAVILLPAVVKALTKPRK
jgi:hypothetical protein